ncbi:MAG: cytochrome c biogenesis CcdA family protein [Candidatus Adiutrix sp.]
MFSLATISHWSAFSGGFLTFFTPCVLPLIPAWFALVTGLSLKEMALAEKKRFSRMFLPTLLFVLGFSFIFCLLGAAAGFLGYVISDFLTDYVHFMRYIAGAILIFFSFHLMGFISPSFLQVEKRAHLSHRPLGLLGAFIVGMAFAAGWTPCVGPVLAVILTMASLEQSAFSGLFLLALFSLGLGVPFLLLSLFWGGALSFLMKFKGAFRWVNRVLGALVFLIAILLISGKLQLLGYSF